MTELFINNVSVDLSDNIQHSLNFAIADIRDPSKRDTSFTKTITLVGSSSTNILFSHIFEVNVIVNSSGVTNFNPSFNPNLKASAYMYSDNILIFSGYVQLKNITVLDKFDVEYEVVLYGKLGDLFFELGEHELTELDFSEFDHVYNKANIEASWAISNIGIGYHYAMIDKGYNDTITWKVKDFQPGFWLKVYIDKIFEYAGYTYDCDFFDSNYFKRLHMPFSGEGFKLTEDVINERRFKTNQVTIADGNPFTGFGTWQTWQFNSETYDAGNNYNTSTYQWTCPASGTYIFNISLVVSVRFIPDSPAYFKSDPGTLNKLDGWAEIVKENSSGISRVGYASALLFANVGMPGNNLIPGDKTYASANVNLSSGDDFISQGDKVYVRFFGRKFNTGLVTYNDFIDAGGSPVGGNLFIVTNVGSTFENEVVNNGYAEGELVLMNTSIPTKIKMKDLLSSTLKKYNLYVEDDKSQPKKVIITTRNEFYSSTTVDWSDKLDLNSPFQIEPMGGLDAKKYDLTWDYDEDYYNKYYKDKYGKVYGNRSIEVSNDFVSNTIETKVIWAATVPAKNNVSDRVLPTILGLDAGIKTTSSKPRLLYYGGGRHCDPWYFLANGTSYTYYLYPYSGHLDDPFNSTVDINFGVVSELMYSAQTIIYTNNNVYNKYHKQFLEEITDKDSKIVTAYFYLTPADILILDFRKKYYFDNNYYRLNRVFDYNPEGNGLTKCEFIFLNSAEAFVSSGISSNGGYDPQEASDTEDGNPAFAALRPNPNKNISTGEGNSISPSAKNILVVGDYNAVGQGVQGAVLVNSSGNVISGGLSNVTLINTTGVTVTEDNVTYVNGNILSNPVYFNNYIGAQTEANTIPTVLYTYFIPSEAMVKNGDSALVEAIFGGNSNTDLKTFSINIEDEYLFDYSSSGNNILVWQQTEITRLDEFNFTAHTKVIDNYGQTDFYFNLHAGSFTDGIKIEIIGTNSVATAGDITLLKLMVQIFRKK